MRTSAFCVALIASRRSCALEFFAVAENDEDFAALVDRASLSVMQ
jgi:hypothetical protein